MSIHRYPTSSLRADYARAGFGFALTAGLTAMALAAPIVAAALGACALLFLAFGVRTWRRQRMVVALASDGISTSGVRCVTLPWDELTGLRLRYYATKRDRTGGWMQLDLAAGRRRLSLESTLDGFADIVRQAAAAAGARGLNIDRATRNNLSALGIAAVAMGT
ncbi:MAG TPA: hypothetical protein VEJ16_15805 [Alphaproteobacteria bacterium]|nr:hypothetical protein [Alphaproteobacteria bacterium]